MRYLVISLAPDCVRVKDTQTGLVCEFIKGAFPDTHRFVDTGRSDGVTDEAVRELAGFVIEKGWY